MKNKKNKKRAMIIRFCLVMMAFFLISASAWAQVSTEDIGIRLGNASPTQIAVQIINWGLGILALITVVVILWGGFVWMFAGGEEEKIEKAKKILRNGVIGLVIVLASWGIATYLMNGLLDMTNATGGTAGNPGSYSYADGNPFYVDHSNPADNETDVSLCHLVAVSFSLPLKQESVTEDSFKVTVSTADKTDGESCTDNTDCKSQVCKDGSCDGSQVQGTFAFSESGYSAVWYPIQDYLQTTTYKVSLSTAVTGVDEITIDTYNLDTSDSKRIFEFTTGTETDEIPPVVDITSVTPYPEDGETEVCRNTPIQTSFSESLDPASVNDENIRLYAYYEGIDPNALSEGEELDVKSIRFSSIGGNADDTFITYPENTLEAQTEYGLSWYSGAYNEEAETVRENFDGAIRDTCGNPLSGDFDQEMEGSPTDDFIESTNAGGDNWTYQWTYTTGDIVDCIPNIEGISYSTPAYYSEDEVVYNDEKAEPDTGSAGTEDSDLITITGDYLYPFTDVEFFNNISGAGMNCFDQDHNADNSCYVSSAGSSEIVLRIPVATQSNHKVKVENENGNDYSEDYLYVESPFIRNLSPGEGPPGQFITVKGANFIDYDPTDDTSAKGTVYMDGVALETPCADGWDNDEIIVKVPENFADIYTSGDSLNLQVVTVDDKYSNKKAFILNDEEPGPGLCVLDPDCSNNGTDNVYEIGQTFGDSEGKVYFSDVQASINDWNIDYSGIEASYVGYKTAYTDIPVTNQDQYEVWVEDDDENKSNSLAFDVPCQEPPALFTSHECDLEDTFYLPNPTAYDNQACINSVVMIAFTDEMADNTDDLIQIFECGSGADDAAYSNENCLETAVGGSWSSGEYLSSEYSGVSDDDTYELFTFTPSSNFNDNTYYRVYIPNAVANENGVTLSQGYSWHFKVREGADECSKDVVNLMPNEEKITAYSSSTACPVNYSTDDDDYTYKASAYNQDCVALRNDFAWHWKIYNYDMADIADFKSDGAVYSEDTINGYNSVCAQSADNEGLAYVTAGPSSSDGSYPSWDTDTFNYGSDWTYDIDQFEVDYGYCNSDEDCVDGDCTSSCNRETSHCEPAITGISPETAGKGGCVTISGCFFGSSRQGNAVCTCSDSTEDSDSTCQVHEGYQTCLLSDQSVCSLEAACDASASTYPGLGAVTFESYTGDYLNTELCGDTWDNDEVTVGVPDASEIAVGDYSVNLTSYYGDTTSYSSLAIQVDPTPCLCQVEPDYGQEGDAITIYGKHFDKLNSSYRYAEFAVFLNENYATGTWTALDSTIYGDDAYQLDTSIASNATSDNKEGVRLVDEDDVISNAKGFDVRCVFNSDCSTRCCSAGLCEAAEVCNACEGKEDCTYGKCLSDCTDGMCEPYIISLSPNQGNSGQPITVSGCHFGSYYSLVDAAAHNGLYSKVTLNEQEAEFACNENDTWNNEQIKILAPDGIFNTEVEADVIVTQVYDSGAGFVAQDSTSGNDYCTDETCTTKDDCNNVCLSQWNTAKFDKDDSCQTVDIPVLCDIDDANGPYTTTEDHDLSGYSFYDITSNFCTCDGARDQTCTINVDEYSCEIDHNYTCYADPEDETAGNTVCSTELDANSGENYYFEQGCSEALYTNQIDCEDNGFVWSTINKCRCVNLEDESQNCWIDVDNSSCEFNETETCNIDNYEEGNSDTYCNENHKDYSTIGSEVLFAYNQNSLWTYLDSENLTSNVPAEAETGNVYVQATDNSSGEQCTSNGLNFDVTCNTCGDCNDDLMCDLTQGEDVFGASYGVCTTNTTGFCAQEPDSCCGNTGCRETILEAECLNDTDEDGVADVCTTDDGCTCYNEDNTNYCTVSRGDTTCDITDGGACYQRPLVEESEGSPAHGDVDVCTNAELRVQFDSEMTTNDAVINETEPEYANHFKLVTENIYLLMQRRGITFNSVADTDNLLASAEQDTTTSVTLMQNGLLNLDTSYYILIDSPQDNTGLISKSNYIGLGCEDAQASAGICTEDGDMLAIKFTTTTDTSLAGGCAPAYVDIEAQSDSFKNAGYTFIESEEEQGLIARVYYSENDVRNDDDDQAITGIAGSLDWDYQWDTKYDSLEDLSNAKCPTVGIITGGDYGTCGCNLGETDCTASENSCTIDYGQESCSVSDTSEICYFDEASCASADGCSTCNAVEGCQCTVAEESCTYVYGETSCTLEDRDLTIADGDASVTCAASNTNDSDYYCDVEYGSATCTTDLNETCTLDDSQVCSEEYDDYNEGDFLENQRTQKVTADGVEGDGWATATIVGEADNSEHNWEGKIDDSQYLRVLFCDDVTYLSTYDDDVDSATFGTNSYNFNFAYCRGSDSENLLPDFDISMIKSGSSSDQYLQEYLFTNTENEDLIGIKIYSNNLDNNTGTIYDVVKPDTWASLRLEKSGSYTATTVDGYEAVEDSYNTLVSSANLGGGTLYPNIYMISVNKNAEGDTLSVLSKIKELWTFNTNGEFAPSSEGTAEQGCQEEKEKLVRDTDRITDFGEMNYLLAKYYNTTGSGKYPDVGEGSYIQYLTNSVWPSWDSVLGNQLSRALFTDPNNAFATEGYCDYDEADNKYYDESGTCWDPINKDYTCSNAGAEESYVYQYKGAENGSGYNLYGNLEYDSESWAWNNYSGDPCSGMEYSSGCSCFDYQVVSSSMNDFYYGTCDTDAEVCNSDSGYNSGSFCESDNDCQIVQ